MTKQNWDEVAENLGKKKNAQVEQSIRNLAEANVQQDRRFNGTMNQVSVDHKLDMGRTRKEQSPEFFP